MSKRKIKVSAIEQIGFAVKDAKEAGELFEQLFDLEPFSYYCDEPLRTEGLYYGKPSQPLTKSAMGQWGDIELEFLEPAGGDCPWNDAVLNGKSGINHIRFAVDDLDEALERMEELGCVVVWRTDYEPYNRSFAYTSHEKSGLVFEMSAPIKK